jgi:hypothetical protein
MTTHENEPAFTGTTSTTNGTAKKKIRERGHPLGHWSTEKTLSASVFYSGHLCGANPFAVPIRSCVFVPFDSAHGRGQAIDWCI